MLSELSGKRCIKRTDNGAWQTGNDSTPMEVDALTKGKGQGKGESKGKGKEKAK